MIQPTPHNEFPQGYISDPCDDCSDTSLSKWIRNDTKTTTAKADKPSAHTSRTRTAATTTASSRSGS
jgi:hypothetical protein